MPTDAAVTVVGHITEPETRFTANGTEIVSFSLCTKKQRQQTTVETWWRVSVFGNRAKGLITLMDRGSFGKGTLVQVRGETYMTEFQGRNGPMKNLEIDAENVVVMFPPDNQASRQQGYRDDGDTRNVPSRGEFDDQRQPPRNGRPF